MLIVLLPVWGRQFAISLAGYPPFLSDAVLLAPLLVSLFSLPDLVFTIIGFFRKNARFRFYGNAVFFALALAYLLAGLVDAHSPHSKTPPEFVIVALVSLLVTAVPILALRFKNRAIN
jgi:hypothetical protein